MRTNSVNSNAATRKVINPEHGRAADRLFEFHNEVNKIVCNAAFELGSGADIATVLEIVRADVQASLALHATPKT